MISKLEEKFYRQFEKKGFITDDFRKIYETSVNLLPDWQFYEISDLCSVISLEGQMSQSCQYAILGNNAQCSVSHNHIMIWHC